MIKHIVFQSLLTQTKLRPTLNLRGIVLPVCVVCIRLFKLNLPYFDTVDRHRADDKSRCCVEYRRIPDRINIFTCWRTHAVLIAHSVGKVYTAQTADECNNVVEMVTISPV